MRSAVAGLLILSVIGCAGTSRWQTTRHPDIMDAAALLASDTQGLLRDERPDEMPLVPVRTRLRPCCAFGTGLRVRVGAIKIPGFAIDNIRSPDRIGTHTYDAGQRGQEVIHASERNGLVYTCRGGFIDIAHVRDYADWTLYLATQIGRKLETGGVIELPDPEGGQRRFLLQPVDPKLIRIVGRRKLTASLAVWAGFQLSLWHEIATWYGWSNFGLFSERASAFSPDDLYSNLLGAKIVGPIISARNDLSEALFNRAIDGWLEQTLHFLGAVPQDTGEAAMASVDGYWWDSAARLPDPNLVLRRSLQLGARIEPWLVPARSKGPELNRTLLKECDGNLEPHILLNPSRIPDLAFESVLKLEIDLDDSLERKPALRKYEGRVDQSQFPALLEQIRGEARAEFGDLAVSPATD